MASPTSSTRLHVDTDCLDVDAVAPVPRCQKQETNKSTPRPPSVHMRKVWEAPLRLVGRVPVFHKSARGSIKRACNRSKGEAQEILFGQPRTPHPTHAHNRVGNMLAALCCTLPSFTRRFVLGLIPSLDKHSIHEPTICHVHKMTEDRFGLHICAGRNRSALANFLPPRCFGTSGNASAGSLGPRREESKSFLLQHATPT